MNESSMSNRKKENNERIKRCRPKLWRLFLVVWVVLAWALIALLFGIEISASGGFMEIGQSFVVLWAISYLIT